MNRIRSLVYYRKKSTTRIAFLLFSQTKSYIQFRPPLATWTRSCVMGSGWPCWSRGIGAGDLLRSCPTTTIVCTIQIGAQQVYSLRWDQTFLKFWASCNNFFLHHVVLWKIDTNLLVCPHLNVLNNFRIRIEIIFLVMIFWGDSDTPLKRSRYWDRYIHIDIYLCTLLGIGDLCLVYFLISGITFWNNKRESIKILTIKTQNKCNQ